MVSVNGMEMPMRNRSGLLVLEDPSGHQSWALIVDATVEYGGDVEFTADELPEMKVVATLPPGELLRTAITEEVDEPNVLVYSRLLVEVLREERDRYSKLEQELMQERKWRAEAVARKDDALEDRDEQLHAVWRHGAAQGWFHGQPMQGKTLDEVLMMNPHPDPGEETEGGCHLCGGPDH